jgi:hypothetical protein
MRKVNFHISLGKLPAETSHGRNQTELLPASKNATRAIAHGIAGDLRSAL